MKQASGHLVMDIVTLRSQWNDCITINKKEVYFDGLRWKLGINTNPCIQLRKGGRCTYCGFRNYPNLVPPENVGQVLEEILRNNDLTDVHRLELYVSGSFFDDDEVSFNSRLEVVRSVERSQIKEVLLESRPEFITGENLNPLVDIIDGRRITIGIGVETMDATVRNKLSKGFSTKDLTKSLSRIAQSGMNFQAYLLLNPPVINNDRDAVIDIVNSSTKIMSLTNKLNCPLVLAIQPFFLAGNSTIAQDPLQKDRVRPPWLYTVALTLRLLDNMRAKDKSGFSLVLGNEVDNVDTILLPSNYTGHGNVCSCTERTRKYLREVNISRQKLREGVDMVLGSQCHCKIVWQNEIGREFDKYLLMDQPA